MVELFEEQVVSFGKVVRVDLRTSSVFGVKDSDLKLVSLYCSKRSHLKQIRSLSETLKNSPYATTVF